MKMSASPRVPIFVAETSSFNLCR